MKKKLLSALLSVAMVASLLVGCGGAKTEEAPATVVIEDATYYEIGSGAQLAWFANQVNGGQTEINAVLTNDIYLNGADDYTNKWNSRAIGNDGKFAGVFDGAGFTIYGLYSENKYVDQGGLFCYIGSTGVVKNLTGNLNITNNVGAFNIESNANGFGSIENGGIIIGQPSNTGAKMTVLSI